LNERTRKAIRLPSAKRSVAARRRSKLETIDSPPRNNELLSTAELARLLNVNPKTVGRWASKGGHRRYRWADVAGLAQQGIPPDAMICRWASSADCARVRGSALSSEVQRVHRVVAGGVLELPDVT
jgi:hypothetical protein